MTRRIAVVLAVLASGCTDAWLGPDPATTRSALFDRVWQEVDSHYSHFVVKGIDWDSLRAVYAPRAVQATSDWALAGVIGALLAELKDAHVSLFVGDQVLGYSGYDSRPAPFRLSVVRDRYVTDWGEAPKGLVQYGYAAPDVGYVRFSSFGASGHGADLDAALADLARVRAIVVDVRGNQGGSAQAAVEVAARFADRARTFAYVQYRDGPRHDDFTPRQAVTVSPAGSRRFGGPVVVLANRHSYSAAEHFVLALDAIPTVTIVGDSTGGALGSPLTLELPNGWTYRFPQWIEYTSTGVCIEGIGFAPDVWVRGSDAELSAGRDAVLDTALAILRRGFQAPTATGRFPAPGSASPARGTGARPSGLR